MASKDWQTPRVRCTTPSSVTFDQLMLSRLRIGHMWEMTFKVLSLTCLPIKMTPKSVTKIQTNETLAKFRLTRCDPQWVSIFCTPLDEIPRQRVKSYLNSSTDRNHNKTSKTRDDGWSLPNNSKETLESSLFWTVIWCQSEVSIAILLKKI